MSALARFHEDERGMETIQVVMALALAALITAYIQQLWPRMKAWFELSVNQVLRWQG